MKSFQLSIALLWCLFTCASAHGDNENENQSVLEPTSKTVIASKSKARTASFAEIKNILTSANVGDPSLLTEGKVLMQYGYLAAIRATAAADDECKLYAFNSAKAIMNAFPVNVTRVVVMLFDCQKHQTNRLEFRKKDITKFKSQNSNPEKLLQNTTLAILPLFPDYGRPLLGEYQLIRTNYKEVVIVRPRNGLSEGALYGNVQKLAIKAPYVTGFTTLLEGDENLNKRTGYFLLNTQSHELKAGLTEEIWRETLQQADWSNPSLVTPPMFICDPLENTNQPN